MESKRSVDRPIISFFYLCIRKVLGPFIKLIWVKEVTGINNIPAHGPCIVAFNHQSYFDFICFIAVSPRNIHYLSAEKFFTHPLWKILMKITGQIPVQRESHDKEELHQIVHAHLMAGKIIGIFPEGTRNPDSKNMSRAFNGVTRYAIQGKVPVVPVGIRGAFEVMSRHDHKPKFKKLISFHVGEAIHFTKHHNTKLEEDTYKSLTDAVMIEIEKLSGKSYPHAG